MCTDGNSSINEQEPTDQNSVVLLNDLCESYLWEDSCLSPFFLLPFHPPFYPTSLSPSPPPSLPPSLPLSLSLPLSFILDAGPIVAAVKILNYNYRVGGDKEGWDFRTKETHGVDGGGECLYIRMSPGDHILLSLRDGC